MTDSNTDATRKVQTGGNIELGGLLGGLGGLIGQLSELAEKGKELKEIQERLGDGEKVQGVYGFSIRTNIGRNGGNGNDSSGGFTVEPFGNVKTDEETGRTVVQEVSEPIVDVFEESDHVLVVAEMPGIGDEDVQLELADDILTITAEQGSRKFRKEVLLPASFTAEAMSHTCRNGVLEVKLSR